MASIQFSKAGDLFMISLPTTNRMYNEASIKNAEDQAERAPCSYRVHNGHKVYEVDEIALDRLKLINAQISVELLNLHMFSSGGFLESLKTSPRCVTAYTNSIDTMVNLGVFPSSGVQTLFPSLDHAIKQRSKDSDRAASPRTLPQENSNPMSRSNRLAFGTRTPLPVEISASRASARTISTTASQGSQVIIPLSGQQAPRQDLGFRPSWKLTGGHRLLDEDAISRARKVGLDLDSNYEGKISERRIQNAQIPPYANCAVHISGIPVQTTSADILRSITEGKIFAFNRVDPNSRHKEAAANVTFIDRQAAERYMIKSQSSGIRINGTMVDVNWNRIAAGPSSNRLQSRVIRITGPREEINAEALEDFLHTRTVFELVDRSELWHAQGRKSATLSFCQILGQSRIAVRCLRQHAMEKGMDWVVSYSKDPCDPQDFWRHEGKV